MHESYSDPPTSDEAELLTEQWKLTSGCLFAFLAVLFLILCYCVRHLCRERQLNRRVTAAVANEATSRTDKLDPEVLAALPVFVFDGELARREKHLECAICLMEFKEGERGLLLPRCCHRFHVECVEMWFKTRSSCPLCRVNVGSYAGDDLAV